MKQQRFSGQFEIIFRQAVRLAKFEVADAILLLLDGPTDWKQVRKCGRQQMVIVAADTAQELEGAAEAGLNPIVLLDRVQQGLSFLAVATLTEHGEDEHRDHHQHQWKEDPADRVGHTRTREIPSTSAVS